MAEVFLIFDNAVPSGDGSFFTARVCGREGERGTWDGWLEFEPRAGGTSLRTGRETTQPNRSALAYWASGLTAAYLEGALQRALEPGTGKISPGTREEVVPDFAGPAPVPDPRGSTGVTAAARPHAVLDPFAVQAQGDDVLRAELGALDEGHLRTIVRAYDLADISDADLAATPRAALVELVINGVRSRGR